MNETLNAYDIANAGLGFTPDQRDPLGLAGIYHGICEGYKGQYEAEFLVEHARKAEMQRQVDDLIRRVQFAHSPMARDDLHDQIERMFCRLDPLGDYLKTLTEVKWDLKAKNVVTTVGANLALDTILAGSSYTAATYMFLIGAVSYSSVPVIADTMSSHATWTEAGTTNAPTYTSPRKTISWSSAASKSKSPSSAPVFAITGTGTAKGVGIVYGTGAVSTIDSTAGVLYSAGLFSGGDQAVVNTNTLTVTYAATA